MTSTCGSLILFAAALKGVSVGGRIDRLVISSDSALTVCSSFLFLIHGMAPARERSPARNGTDPKRLKTTHVSPSDSPSPPAAAVATPSLININTNTDLASQFAYEIFNHNYIAKLHTDYLDSNPFKHSVVEKLFQDELLVKVKDECLRLNFTQKETDIFKVCLFTLKIDLTHCAFDTDQTDRRSGLTELSPRLSDIAVNPSSDATRCLVFASIPPVSKGCNTLRTFVWTKARYGRQFLYSRLSSPKP